MITEKAGKHARSTLWRMVEVGWIKRLAKVNLK